MNIEVDFQRAPPCVAVSGIMDETGLVMTIIRTKSIKKVDHLQFLKDFRKKLGHDEEVAIFYDGLHFHKGKDAKEVMTSLNIFGVLNKAYCSYLNSIE
jgi:hypothetical protein